MSAPSLTSRADLLRWIKQCKESMPNEEQRNVYIAESVEMLGYEAPKQSSITAARTQNSDDANSIKTPQDTEETDSEADEEVSFIQRPAEAFWFVAKRETYATPEQAKERLPKELGTKTLTAEDQQGDPNAEPLAFQPILPQQRFTPFIRQQFKQQRGKKLDVKKLIKRVATHQPIHELPQKPRILPAGNVTVLMDLNDRLLPFWEDMYHSCDLIKQKHSKVGLDMRVLDDEKPGGQWHLYDQWVQKKLDPQEWKAIPAQSVVFILSDVGQLASDNHIIRYYWLQFLKQLKRQNIQTIILAPIAAEHQCPKVQALAHQVLWHRHASLVPKQHKSNKAQHHQQVEQALALLSLATHIEPELCRALLALLPHDEAHSGIEADLYLHPHVQWGYTSIALKTEKRQHYQDQFEKLDATLKNQALQSIKQHHIGQFPAVWHQAMIDAERVLDPNQKANWQADIDKAREWMQRFAVTLSDNEHNEGMIGFARRYLQRMHPEQVKHYREATSALYSIAYNKEIEAGQEVPEEYDPQIIQQVMRAETEKPRTCYLFQLGQGLWVSAEPKPKVAHLEIGKPLAEFQTLQSQVFLNQQPIPIKGQQPTHLFDTAQAGEQVLDTGLETITLAGITKPHWASHLEQNEEHWIATLSLGDENRLIGRYAKDEDSFTDDIINWVQQSGNDHISIDQYGLYCDLDFNGVIQRFRWIEPGEFMMGSPEYEKGREPHESLKGSETQHKVIISQGYWLADTAVTQELWHAITKQTPSYHTQKLTGLKTVDQLPVEQVSWDDSQALMKQLTAIYPQLDWNLPTEAEWEYACRAGTTTAFSYGDEVTLEDVNYSGIFDQSGWDNKALQRTEKVKTYPPNTWGLYEMHGNVWEWCQDYWDQHLGKETVIDPVCTQQASYRVLRGGGWSHYGWDVRSAIRSSYSPVNRSYDVGLRLSFRSSSLAKLLSGKQSRLHGGRAASRQPQAATGSASSMKARSGIVQPSDSYIFSKELNKFKTSVKPKIQDYDPFEEMEKKSLLGRVSLWLKKRRKKDD